MNTVLKDLFIINNYVKICLLFLFILFLFCGCKNNDNPFSKYGERGEILRGLLEMAYFEGQKDAIEGDIRIKLMEDSIYVWSKSPWEDGTKPVYIPTQKFK